MKNSTLSAVGVGKLQEEDIAKYAGSRFLAIEFAVEISLPGV